MPGMEFMLHTAPLHHGWSSIGAGGRPASSRNPLVTKACAAESPFSASRLASAIAASIVLGISWDIGSGSFEGASSELNNLAQGAKCLLGHNLVRHDLPILRERAPELPILQLPIIDTLVLSPICFPENPYHRLIKVLTPARECV